MKQTDFANTIENTIKDLLVKFDDKHAKNMQGSNKPLKKPLHKNM